MRHKYYMGRITHFFDHYALEIPGGKQIRVVSTTWCSKENPNNYSSRGLTRMTQILNYTN